MLNSTSHKPTIDSLAIGKFSETRGKLKAARIIKEDKNALSRVNPMNIVHCMFNPYEYTISKANNFAELGPANPGNTPKAELFKPSAQTLKLDLFFDTYEETDESKRDVSEITNKLWTFMKVEKQKGDDPLAKGGVPQVAFHWGVFYFVSYITSMAQTFTLFTKDGIPVRAKVNVTFTQYSDKDDYIRQNPTSGSDAISRVWQVVAGDRLDLIAAQIYRNPAKWRLIADYNNIGDPQSIRPGQMLSIPYDREIR